MPARRLAVVAFGGNALIRRGEEGTQTEQIENSDRLATRLVPLIQGGYSLVLVHGNGPQVGNILIQVEEAVTKVPPISLDVCVAQSEGSIGYMLARSLINALAARRVRREVICLVTPVVVERTDPAFRKPSKPIGPFYTRYRAEYLMKRMGWLMVEDSGRGYRKVVASPRPQKILGLGAVKELVAQDRVVITGGGGGIPVFRTDEGRLKGIEAVIDKDHTAGLLAAELDAELFVLLTGVDQVYLNFGRPDQIRIERLTSSEARRHLEGGQFPPGSMGPKVETAATFVEKTAKEVLITSVERMKEALAGRAGTRVVPDSRRSVANNRRSRR
ncbi:MAG TPA: carbamate kinase [Candidatus Polarisedimenticolia bacterium]|nr:carbamate kinase [Candidatus Polarisedimenticolia bacterium]